MRQTARDFSRSDYMMPEDGTPATWDAIQAGALQRIADATEKTAAGLIEQRDLFKVWYDTEHTMRRKAEQQARVLLWVLTGVCVFAYLASIT